VNFVQESEVFATMFQLPQDPNAMVDGKTDKQPIMLEGVKTEDFKQLLRVMYARYVGHSNNIFILKLKLPSAFAEEEKLAEQEWVSVLVLAARWAMERLHQLAIKKLTQKIATDPYKLVVMGLEHNVDSWLVRGILLLVLREDPMGEEDANRIGISAVLKVSTIREWTLRWSYEQSSYRRVQPPEGEIVVEIKKIFGLVESTK